MPWYALRSKPNKEEALWREVGARGHEVFYPRLRVQPINPRARCIRPYFPGYLFVQALLAQTGTGAFSGIPYSHGLVSFGGEPAEVPDPLVAAIRRRVDEVNDSGGVGFDPNGVPVNRPSPGDRVEINAGPFGGYQAVFDGQIAGTDRVRVLLQLLQLRPIKLDIAAEQIQLTKRR